jgi:hypothetical protein
VGPLTWILSSWVQPEISQLVTYRGILVILYCVKLLKYPYSQLTEFESSLVEVQLERILIRGATQAYRIPYFGVQHFYIH